jgi:hypothetical protein
MSPNTAASAAVDLHVPTFALTSLLTLLDAPSQALRSSIGRASLFFGQLFAPKDRTDKPIFTPIAANGSAADNSAADKSLAC